MPLTKYPAGISSMGLPLTGAVNPFGNVYFVVTSGGSDGNTGLDTQRPFATIAKAISDGSAGDTIVLGPGTHSVDVSTAALVPLADMQFVAAIPPWGGKPTTIITHDADDGANLVTVDVDGVGFYGIEFLHVAGASTAVTTMSVSQTAAVTGITFQDCWFNQNSVDIASIHSIAADDATNATTGMVVRNCRFLGGDATTNAAIYIDIGVAGVPSALIENNIFQLESTDDDAIGINFADPVGANKNYGITIRNNDFIGATDGAPTAIGIVFASTMTELEIIGIIRTNYFSTCGAEAITKNEADICVVWNYVGDDATGGTLVISGA